MAGKSVSGLGLRKARYLDSLFFLFADFVILLTLGFLHGSRIVCPGNVNEPVLPSICASQGSFCHRGVHLII